MILTTEQQLIELINILVNMLKSIQLYPGLSVFFLIQTILWLGVVFTLVWFAMNAMSGGFE